MATPSIVISISWELYEIIIGVTIEKNYVQDTSIDLIMDALGALTGLVYYVRVHLVSNSIDKDDGT